MAEATAAMMMMGTPTRTARQISEQLADIGASVSFGGGGGFGGRGGGGGGGGSASITVSALSENFDAALEIIERHPAPRQFSGR